MRLHTKGFAFVPLLVVLFLLIISAVTSYVVINQGTGGYKSRAAVTTACSSYTNLISCVAQGARCHWSSTNTGRCMNKIPGGSSCSASPAAPPCVTGFSCLTNVCLPPTNTACAQRMNQATCRVKSDCEWNASSNVCKYKSPSTTTPACTSYTNAISCAAQGTRCTWSSTSGCGNATTSGSACTSYANAISCAAQGTRCSWSSTNGCINAVGTTTPDKTLCDAVGESCCTSSVGLGYCDTASKVACQTSTGKCISTDPLVSSSCNKIGNSCCTFPNGTRYCDTASNVICKVSLGTCVQLQIQDEACKKIGGLCTEVGANATATSCPSLSSPYVSRPKLIHNLCMSSPASVKCCAPANAVDPNTGGGGNPPSSNPPSSNPPSSNPPSSNPPTNNTPTDPKPSTTPSITTPPTTTGNATLAFTLKFQGVTGNPKGGKTVPFKVKLKGSTVTDYKSGTLTANSSGKWTGSVDFSGIVLGPDTKYTVYIKAGKHFQKRICGFAPTESPAGTYNCTDSAIPLTSGVNNLDFSGILQLVGDLPSSSGEQNGIVDSYDISYILNNLGSTEQNKLSIGDLNFDGVTDSQDRSLIIQSLNVKYDDE